MKTLPLLLLLTAISLSCQTKPKQEAGTTSSAVANDSAVALSKRPGPGAPRSAADRLVRALYFEHLKKENPFRETKDRSLVDQFFAKPTADRIWNSKNPNKSTLHFNAPDKAIKKMWVEPAAVGGSKAVVFVTFENQGNPGEIKLTLRQVAGRWRITDMLYPGGRTLTQLLR